MDVECGDHGWRSVLWTVSHPFPDCNVSRIEGDMRRWTSGQVGVPDADGR